MPLSHFGIDQLERETFLNKAPFANWHEHSMAWVIGSVGIPCGLLISRSKDGEVIHHVGTRFGYYTARGSSTRGGKSARMALKDMLNQGIHAAITVDGPTGPRHESKPGVLKSAIETQTAIIPVCAIADRSWVFKKTWDQSRLPKPFSKVTYQFGNPILPKKDLSGEEFEQQLKALDIELKATSIKALENQKRWSEGAQKLPLSTYHKVKNASASSQRASVVSQTK